MARICQLSDKEKVQALPILLYDEALSFYMGVHNSHRTYENVLQRLVDNYVKSAQRNRTLILWQSLRLSQAMHESPTESELEVFREFCNRPSRLQKQLDPAYRTDNFLRDQFIISADTSQIAQSLHERLLLTSQEARSRIATFPCSEPRSAEALIANLRTGRQTHAAHYTLGNRYGRDAWKTVKGTPVRSNNFHEHKISSKWIRGNLSCYVLVSRIIKSGRSTILNKLSLQLINWSASSLRHLFLMKTWHFSWKISTQKNNKNKIVMEI